MWQLPSVVVVGSWVVVVGISEVVIGGWVEVDACDVIWSCVVGGDCVVIVVDGCNVVVGVVVVECGVVGDCVVGNVVVGCVVIVVVCVVVGCVVVGCGVVVVGVCVVAGTCIVVAAVDGGEAKLVVDVLGISLIEISISNGKRKKSTQWIHLILLFSKLSNLLPNVSNQSTEICGNLFVYVLEIEKKFKI